MSAEKIEKFQEILEEQGNVNIWANYREKDPILRGRKILALRYSLTPSHELFHMHEPFIEYRPSLVSLT